MKNRGFTLIELMIVVAIIGILTSVFVMQKERLSQPANSVRVNSVECKNGLLIKNGDVVIENGNAVKC